MFSKSRLWTSPGAVVFLVGVLFAGSACSKSTDSEPVPPSTTSSSSTTTQSTQVPGPTTRGVSAEAIKVGGVASLTGPGGDALPGLSKGAEARFARSNATSELPLKIDFVGVRDDGGTAAGADAALRALVDTDSVFGIVPAGGLSGLSADYLNQFHVPYVGWGTNSGFCDREYGFGVTGCLVSTELTNESIIAAGVEAAGGLQAKTVAIVAEELNNEGLPAVRAAVEKLGGTVVFSEGAFVTDGEEIEATNVASAIKTSNSGGPPDVVIYATTFRHAALISAVLRLSGFAGAQIGLSTYLPGVLGALPDVSMALDTTFANVQGIGAPEFGGDTWNQLVSDVKAVGGPEIPTLGVILGYSQAELFLAFVKNALAAEPTLTAESFVKAPSVGYEFPGLGNVLGTSSWPASKREPIGCSAGLQASGGYFKPVVDLKCSGAQVSVVQPSGKV